MSDIADNKSIKDKLARKNVFVNQLEEEILKSHPIRHIIETADYALMLNDAEADIQKRQETKKYINFLVDTYKQNYGVKK